MSDPPASPTQQDASGLGDTERRRVADFLDQPPATVGPYHILEVIGKGGMGIVYRAEQRQPVRRIVALKLIKLGMDTREVIARFESERQALAIMNHPNVARVFDAGTSDAGRPYFVMEYVPGESITHFCDRQRMTVRQRLELFLQACEAVQHAHQKAIIHRDLKPSNVLVMLDDAAGTARVKIIDFGVAKAISSTLTQRTLFTQTGQIVGTPEYMSPEQADGVARDVDTRSDIYSLGVLLYELLAGALPVDTTTLRSAAYQEIQRVVREMDPPRPSARLSGLGDAAREVAHRRKTDLAALERQLRSELEWIPLKAMQKDRAQRYATAAELGADIRNYLSNQPLRAGPPSASYRVRKFLRRNIALAGAAAAVMLALLFGIAGTTWQAIRAARAERASRAALADAQQQRLLAESGRQEAEAVVQFLTANVLDAATPERMPDKAARDLIVRVMLDPAAEAVKGAFDDRPAVEAAVRRALASCYHSLGRADLATPHALIAVHRRTDTLGPAHPATIDATNLLALLLRDQGKFAEAETLLAGAVQNGRTLGDEHPSHVDSIIILADLYLSQGRFAEAESTYRDALARERRGPNRSKPLINATQNLARVLLLTGRADEAVALLQPLRTQADAYFDAGDPSRFAVTNTLAQALEQLGRYNEARELFVEALSRFQQILGDDHRHTLILRNNLGSLLRKMRDYPAAESHYRHVLATMRHQLGDQHPSTLTSMNNLGTVLMDQRRLDEAEAVMREALSGRRRVLGDSHAETLQTMYGLGNILRSLDRLPEAEQLYAELYTRCQISELPPRQAAQFMSEWGVCLVKLQRHDDAEAPLGEAHRRLLETGQRATPQMARVLGALADVCANAGRLDDESRWRAELAELLASTRPSS